MVILWHEWLIVGFLRLLISMAIKEYLSTMCANHWLCVLHQSWKTLITNLLRAYIQHI